MKSYKSGLGQSIDVWRLGSGPVSVLLVGGVHGDETEGIQTCREIIRRLVVKETELPAQVSLTIVACLNPDGQLLRQRSNSNNVDLNRNLPTSNWRAEASNPRYQPGHCAASEPETKAFLEIVSDTKPVMIISVHSFSESLLLYPSNDVNSDFRPLIDSMANNMKVPVAEKMNYEIFGSLSRWSLENKIATLTVELLRDQPSNHQIIQCANAIETLLLSLSV